MTVLRRYTFKLYPNRAQDAALHEQRVMCCQLWNALLQMREEAWRRQSQIAKEERRTPTAFDQAKEITKLRAACPEWRGMNADSQALVAKMLDDAFKAFFRRAKAGAGASSGYPRYRAAKLWETIPFREMGKGWKFEYGRCAAGAQAQSGAHSKVCPGIPGGEPENAGHSQGGAIGLHCRRSGGEPENAGHSQGDHVEVSARPSGGRLYVKGIPGLIRTRGKLPRNPVSWRNSNILFRDGLWWLSVCVEMEPARVAGPDSLKISFDLLDQFARVERVDGAMSAPRESANQTHVQGVAITSGADTPETGAGDRSLGRPASSVHGADTPETGAGDRLLISMVPLRGGGDAPQAGAGDRLHEHLVGLGFCADSKESSLGRVECSLLRAKALTANADAIKSQRDLRHKRRSWRWRRETARAALLTGRAARIRRDALHLFTTEMTRAAACLEVAAPSPREVIRSAKGDAREWGAAVEVNATLNRNTLNQAPGLALQMLTYKAAEAGIPLTLMKDRAPVLAVGADLSKAVKAARRAARTMKENAA